MLFEKSMSRLAPKSAGLLTGILVLTALVVIVLYEFFEHFVFRARSRLVTHILAIGSIEVFIGLMSYFMISAEKKRRQEKIRCEACLGESMGRFRKLVLHIPGLLFQTRRSVKGYYEVSYVTDKIKEIFGCSFEDVRNSITPLVSVIAREDLPALYEAIEASAENLTVLQHSFRVTLPGESTKWLYVEGTPEQLSDGSVLWHGQVNDITRPRSITEERLRLQRLESIGVLAGGIAHDFNNMLTSVIANVQLAMMQSVDARQETLLNAALTGCEKASGLTRQLLVFSKGGIPAMKTASMRQIIEDSVSLFLGESSQSKCSLNLPDDLWSVCVDGLQVTQVFQNLIINASQAMPGGGLIRISAANTTEPHIVGLSGPHIHVSVSDTGVGIPDAYIDKIFEPYFSTKGNGSNHGLGLAIVMRIIEKHKGKIFVRSVSGKGTVFHLYLPAQIESEGQVSVESNSEEVSRKLKILAMDDDPMLQEAIAGLAAILGHECKVVRDGAGVLEEYALAMDTERPFDVVLLDLTIPGGMGGGDTLLALRELNPEVKCIVSSGYADQIPSGFDAVLPKPYRVKDMEKAIKEALGS